jgi:hypothetical protein
MKKIGIITILNVNNYGAELQAFALQFYLRQLGHEVEIINYLYYKNPNFKSTKKSAPFVELKTKQKLKEFLFPYFNNVKSLPFYKDKKKRDVKFRDFHQEHSKVSRPYDSIEKLYSASLDYDVYISGSDQIWNPHTNTNITPYFLDFAPKNKLKIAYASSFGVENIPEKYHYIYKKHLSKFDNIAVREKSGVEIVKKILNRRIQWVVDPTFLLSKNGWKEIAIQPKFKESYLLLYVLTDSEYITRTAEVIAKNLGLKIVRICKNASKEDKGDHILNIIDAGPKEFLGWFMNSSFVLTTSFHGTCFALNFEKSFFSILKNKKANNSRQIDLLTEVGLENRIKYVNDEIKVDDLLIDFNFVTVRLQEKVRSSKIYLKEVLNHSNELSEIPK